MKKQIILSSVVLFTSLVLFACKKDYECSCHKADGTHEHINIKEKKSDAESVCKAKAVGSYTACELE